MADSPGGTMEQPAAKKKLLFSELSAPAKILLTLAVLVLQGLLYLYLFFAALFALNLYVKADVRENLCKTSDFGEGGSMAGTTYDAILILGCRVHPSGDPSDMLKDRLDRGIELYQAGLAPVVLLSGDRSPDYDEVGAMEYYCLTHGVPSRDMVLDTKGYSTFESMTRAREVFGYRSVLVVTQQYHLYRALYIGKAQGLEVVGVASDQHTYALQWKRDLREFFARPKDVFQCLVK